MLYLFEEDLYVCTYICISLSIHVCQDYKHPWKTSVVIWKRSISVANLRKKPKPGFICAHPSRALSLGALQLLLNFGQLTGPKPASSSARHLQLGKTNIDAWVKMKETVSAKHKMLKNLVANNAAGDAEVLLPHRDKKSSISMNKKHSSWKVRILPANALIPHYPLGARRAVPHICVGSNAMVFNSQVPKLYSSSLPSATANRSLTTVKIRHLRWTNTTLKTRTWD